MAGRGVTMTAPPTWPTWPASSPAIERAVLDVLRSGRWAISGMSDGTEPRERRFGREFADYLGVGHGVPTTNGSSALVSAFTAMGIGYGDEVLVPGVVWVACASAVARVGAVPVFVDLDADVYAMDPARAAALIGPRTAAILVVHLSSSLADLDAFERLSAQHGLALIEDCSQAHGAMWRGRRVGSFGAMAAFSFQSSKLLTAGEGGIVVTDDAELARAAEQARADGRQWRSGPTVRGFPDLEPGGKVQGHNHCMTEMQAAILSASLPLLDDQNAARQHAVDYLEAAVEPLEGVRILRRRNDPRVDRATFWHLPIQVDAAAFNGYDTEWVRAAVSTRAGLFLEPVGSPFDRSPLYRPDLYRRFAPEHVATLAPSNADLPVSRQIAESCFTVPHHALLADDECLDRLVDAIAAVQRDSRHPRPA